MFHIIPEDKGLSIILKREVNAKLNTIEDLDEKQTVENIYREVLNVIKAIEVTEPQSDEDIDFILDTINTVWNKGILFPLTLKDNEFDNYPDRRGYRYNKRYSYVYIDTNNHQNIINSRAFDVYVRAGYKHKENIQVAIEPFTIQRSVVTSSPIFISKGGVITGEYIKDCIIKPEVIAKHCFTIQNIVKIPVCVIDTGTRVLYVVDHREPKLKALMLFYDVPVMKNEEVAAGKYNIRKYKKLDK